jgi:hypothetical protein
MNANIAWFTAAAVAALSTGCGQDVVRTEASAAADAERRADFRGIIPPSYPICAPFVDDNDETVEGFLVVQTVKDHPSLKNSGVMVGDVCLSWGTRYPEAPETLRDAWLDFLNRRFDDEAVCWFARDKGGKVEVFSCGAAELYECEVALASFGLELLPTAFPEKDAERIRAAAAARKRAIMAEDGLP